MQCKLFMTRLGHPDSHLGTHKSKVWIQNNDFFDLADSIGRLELFRCRSLASAGLACVVVLQNCTSDF
jgi:hypothetical protein